MSELATVAALYVEEGGAYYGIPGVDPWPESRDARGYAGPHPVVAHPPCERWGGVLEHPEGSHAFRRFSLAIPPRRGGWVACIDGGWTCCVEQGHYGHPARKATWLYAHGVQTPELVWGPSSGRRLDEGFHTAAERRRARTQGIRPRSRLSRRECASTPPAFRDALLALARGAR